MTWESNHCQHCGTLLPVSGEGGYFHGGDCLDCGSPAPVGAPLPEDWPERRQLVFERADYRCERVLDGGRRCPMRHDPPRSTLEAHHRLGRRHSAEAAAAGQDIHDLDNLVALCRRHHWSETQGELAADEIDHEEALSGLF